MTDFKAPLPPKRKQSPSTGQVNLDAGAGTGGDEGSGGQPATSLAAEKRRRRMEEQEELYIRDSQGNISGVDGEVDEEPPEEEEGNGGERVPMEPFNLKEEMTTGHFDSDGFYIERAETTDPWMQDVDARGVNAQAAPGVKVKDLSALDQPAARPKPEDILSWIQSLVGLLEQRESVTGALKRLAAARPKRVKRKAGEMAPAPQVPKKEDDFDKCTMLVDRLAASGFHSIYSTKREDLQARVDNIINSRKEYEYQLDSQVYGLFSVNELRQWSQGGMLQGDTLIRKKGDEDWFKLEALMEATTAQ